MTSIKYNPALHTVAVILACATLLPIFVGGLVTSHQAGMSVPDWPNSYGYNMFLFPPRLWIGGILYEHTHRLLASAVGLIALIFAGCAWFSRNSSRRDRWLAAAVLGGVIFQGVLGGLRVVLVKLDLAIVHACVAQAFFCLAAFAAVVTSRWWNEQGHVPGFEPRLVPREGQGAVSVMRRQRSSFVREGHNLVLLGAVTVIVIYLQLIVGALMRHYAAGLAIPDLPLAYGKLLPPMNQSQLDAANWYRVRQLNLDAVSLPQIWLHFAHRIGALLVTIAVLWLALRVITHYHDQPKLRKPAVALLVLLAAQVTLGVLTVLLRKPADIASAHVAVGALVLVTAFVLTARAARLYGPLNRLHGMDRQPVTPIEEHHGLVARAT